MTETRETTTGWACQDCLFLLANGETPEELDEAETAAYLARVTNAEVTLGRTFGEGSCEHDWDAWAAGDESHALECETRDFSWASCDVCGSTLGGSRHAVTFWL